MYQNEENFRQKIYNSILDTPKITSLPKDSNFGVLSNRVLLAATDDWLRRTVCCCDTPCDDMIGWELCAGRQLAAISSHLGRGETI